MCSRFFRCLENSRAGMTFPLKWRYVKLSFKTDICLTIPWPMFPSHGTKQTAAYRIYPQTSLHLFSGSRIPQARCRCKPKWSVACGREDKGGHKAQDHSEVHTVNQIAQVQFCPSAGPLLHRNLAISPHSGRKKVGDKDAERSENFKIRIWVHAVQANIHKKKKKSGKSFFKYSFWKLNTG